MLRYLPIMVLGLFVLQTSFAQSLAETYPKKRSIVVEEFTGINCGYCPEGHDVITSLKEIYGDELHVVNVHATNLADPAPGQPDFRTEFGPAFVTEFGVSGVPAGNVNRYLYDFVAEGTISMGRGAWSNAIETASQMDAPANLGVATSFDADTRELTVEVEVFYTQEVDEENNYIHVAFVENGIIGPQVDYGANTTHQNYEHNAVLRTFITGTWGDEISTSENLVSKTYTYEVPADYVIENCDIVAYVSKDRSDIYDGATIPAIDGTTLVVGELFNSNEAIHLETPLTQAIDVAYTAKSLLNGDESFKVTLEKENEPENWESEFTINNETYESEATLDLTQDDINDLVLEVKPCVDAGLATYTLKMESLSNPNAPVLSQKVYVMSGIRDLVVSNVNADQWADLYSNPLAATELASMTRLNIKEFTDFSKADAIQNIHNIYYNVSWTFPSFTDEIVNQLSTFLDNGGNILIAGQDIGWDQSGVANAYGTATTQAFYNDYMYTTYVNDGSSASTSFQMVEEDEVFGDIGMSSIIDAYGGFTYPEEISPNEGAFPIFYYNNDPTKVGGLRVETDDYKLVYLGIGLEQIGDADVATAIMDATHNWFYQDVEVNTEDQVCEEEMIDTNLDEVVNQAMVGQSRPNPANESTMIPLYNIQEKSVLKVYDINGRLMIEQNIAPNMTQVSLNTSDWASGIYSYQVQTNNQVSESKKMQIVH